MRTIQSILLATDYGPVSKRALQAAAQIARVFGARVSVLNVVHSASDSPSLLVYRKQLSEQSQEDCLHELATRGVEVGQSAFAFGSPAAQILRKAAEWGVDLIVLGAGDRFEHGHLVAGPVAQAVMEHARQPVLAVRPGEETVAFRRLLCPVDFSSVARRGLRNAIRLARALEAQLIVLSVVPELSWLGAAVETGVFAGAQEQHVADWEEEFARFLEQTDFSGVKWSRDQRLGRPDRAIIEAAREYGADLIVMGATGHTGLVRIMMGSVTRGVLHDLPCSIFTVHDEDLLAGEPDEEDLRIARLLYAEAKALMDAGTYEPALAKLDQVLAHNPFHVPALTARAEACEKLGQLERADRCRRRVEMLRHEMLV
jgi:nucleotide-binding universal stress UspA family protein